VGVNIAGGYSRPPCPFYNLNQKGITPGTGESKNPDQK
jgi:hypothetical protein